MVHQISPKELNKRGSVRQNLFCERILTSPAVIFGSRPLMIRQRVSRAIAPLNESMSSHRIIKRNTLPFEYTTHVNSKESKVSKTNCTYKKGWLNANYIC